MVQFSSVLKSSSHFFQNDIIILVIKVHFKFTKHILEMFHNKLFVKVGYERVQEKE